MFVYPFDTFIRIENKLAIISLPSSRHTPLLLYSSTVYHFTSIFFCIVFVILVGGNFRVIPCFYSTLTINPHSPHSDGHQGRKVVYVKQPLLAGKSPCVRCKKLMVNCMQPNIRSERWRKTNVCELCYAADNRYHRKILIAPLRPVKNDQKFNYILMRQSIKFNLLQRHSF